MFLNVNALYIGGATVSSRREQMLIPRRFSRSRSKGTCIFTVECLEHSLLSLAEYHGWLGTDADASRSWSWHHGSDWWWCMMPFASHKNRHDSFLKVWSVLFRRKGCSSVWCMHLIETCKLMEGTLTMMRDACTRSGAAIFISSLPMKLQ